MRCLFTFRNSAYSVHELYSEKDEGKKKNGDEEIILEQMIEASFFLSQGLHHGYITVWAETDECSWETIYCISRITRNVLIFIFSSFGGRIEDRTPTTHPYKR